MTLTRILFICHGNICRSPAAEMVLRHLAEEAGLAGRLEIASAAATSEEIGNDVYPPMKRALAARGIPCHPHAARRVTREEYTRWDHIVCMDEENLRDMRRLFAGDPEGRCSYLMAWAGEPDAEIEDPWYTRRFDHVLSQIEHGCRGLLAALKGV